MIGRTTPEHAYMVGGWAREEGRPESDCPTFEMNAAGKPLRDQWMAGWRAKDREIQAKYPRKIEPKPQPRRGRRR